MSPTSYLSDTALSLRAEPANEDPMLSKYERTCHDKQRLWRIRRPTAAGMSVGSGSHVYMGTQGMRSGFVLPGGSAAEQLDQAVVAEQAGWDGIFVWEAAYGVDPWSLLAAIAMRTARIR